VPGCVYVQQTFNFKKPVYLGDTVIATVTVTSIDKIKRRVFFETTCKVKSKTVIDGYAELYVP
jgi:3-hydroxybutyryl-CoA dehydratase